MNKDSIKKYIKNPYRIFSLLGSKGMMKFLSDKTYLKLVYRGHMEKKLNLEDPKSYNEKLQWLKLYDRNPEYAKMVDKYAVREYVSKIIGEEYLIPLIGVWNKFEDIHFKSLPNQFVLKCTHDSGGVVICKDKSKLNIEATKEKINRSLKRNYYHIWREWPYKNVRPKIICEKFMENEIKNYKFYCFNGIPRFIYISQGFTDDHSLHGDFVDLDWNRMPFIRTDYPSFNNLPNKPNELKKMIEISKKLSKGISFVRVDLYEVDQKVYFSELTFYPCGGFVPIEPIRYDNILGSWIKLSLDKDN